MENMELNSLFKGIYKGKKCLVTGDTGFKGSWLALWLSQLDAEVLGYALPSKTKPNHQQLIKEPYNHIDGDILDYRNLKQVFDDFRPEIVFHLAAQSLVRYSYLHPIETYQTNVIGSLTVFEAARNCNSVKVVINVTSDKCYDNKEWVWGYRENDEMGGHDPYSSSKGCAELLAKSYRKSFLNYEKGIALASVRAGNVIGGGDWSEDRLIPDLIRAASIGETTIIRNPLATRPWQHVLDPLSGYLLLGSELLQGDKKHAEGWNFGPSASSNLTVGEIAELSKKIWPKIDYQIGSDTTQHHEANLLMLDCSKANKVLKWNPVWAKEKTISKTINWYRSFYEDGQVNTISDLLEYIKDAKNQNVRWTS